MQGDCEADTGINAVMQGRFAEGLASCINGRLGPQQQQELEQLAAQVPSCPMPASLEHLSSGCTSIAVSHQPHVLNSVRAVVEYLHKSLTPSCYMHSQWAECKHAACYALPHSLHIEKVCTSVAEAIGE